MSAMYRCRPSSFRDVIRRRSLKRKKTALTVSSPTKHWVMPWERNLREGVMRSKPPASSREATSSRMNFWPSRSRFALLMAITVAPISALAFCSSACSGCCAGVAANISLRRRGYLQIRWRGMMRKEFMSRFLAFGSFIAWRMNCLNSGCSFSRRTISSSASIWLLQYTEYAFRYAAMLSMAWPKDMVLLTSRRKMKSSSCC
mmetsp:Transcript_10196/g.41518  ORF Transcript_10196/g.41518 Transcript_10196/m.41518 type:complete len:202 (-) Transcript_10196:1182-1787(-)